MKKNVIFQKKQRKFGGERKRKYKIWRQNKIDRNCESEDL